MERIGDLTLWDVRRLYRYWASHPPLHEMVAAFLGVKPQPEPMPLTTITPRSPDDPSGIGAMILRFPDGQVKAS